MSKQVTIGAAWVKEAKNGRSYLNVRITPEMIGNGYAMLWKNEQKKFKSQPDYLVLRYEDDTVEPAK